MTQPQIDQHDAQGRQLLEEAQQANLITDNSAPAIWLRFLYHCQSSDQYYNPTQVLAWHHYVKDILPKEIHRKNPDYAMVWIGFARIQLLTDKEGARTTFKYMKLERIGIDVPLFYQTWAGLELSMGNTAKSKSISDQGQRRLSGQDTQPITEAMLMSRALFPTTPSAWSNSCNSTPSVNTTFPTLMSSTGLIQPSIDATPSCTPEAPLNQAVVAPAVVNSTETMIPAPHPSVPISASSHHSAPLEQPSQAKTQRKCHWSELSPSPEKPTSPRVKCIPSVASKKQIRFEDDVVAKFDDAVARQQDSAKENSKLNSSSNRALRKSSMSRSSSSFPTTMNGPALPTSATELTINNCTYVVLEKVGKGGSGEVYKVCSKKNQQIYAVKRVVLNRELGTLDAIRNEVALLQKLKGKANIIELLDSEEVLSQDTVWMVFEFGEIDFARLLRNSTRNSKRLNVTDIRSYWKQMLEAVQTIHYERVVHSDLKPANFMFVMSRLKLIDFGIALSIPGDETVHIVRASQVGTANYMSPEAINGPPDQTTGSFKLGRPSDIWSLGCILYQMVFGRTPFHELTLLQKIRAITDPNHSIPFDLPTGVPAMDLPDLLDVLRSCLDRTITNRPTIPELLQHRFLTTPTISIQQLDSFIHQFFNSGLLPSELPPRFGDVLRRQLERADPIDLHTVLDLSRQDGHTEPHRATT